jgi:hypothetical protein
MRYAIARRMASDWDILRRVQYSIQPGAEYSGMRLTIGTDGILTRDTLLSIRCLEGQSAVKFHFPFQVLDLVTQHQVLKSQGFDRALKLIRTVFLHKITSQKRTHVLF